MKLPDFPLASWEVPPGSDIPLVAPATHVFEAHWRGRETQIWLREINISSHERRFYFREFDTQEIGNWATPRYGVDGVHHIEHIFGLENPWLCLHARRFFFEGAPFGFSGCHELYLNGRGSELIFRGSSARDDFFNFVRLKWPAKETKDFWMQRAAQIGRAARRHMEDAETELGVALRWIHASADEKHCQFLGLSLEEIAQFKEVMRHVLRTQTTLWDEENIVNDFTDLGNVPFRWIISCFCDIATDDSDNAPRVDNLLKQDDDSGLDGWYHVSPSRLEGWKNVLRRHFRLVERGQVAMNTREWPFSVPSVSGCIEVCVERPTAHEVIESAAALREWWPNVAAPADFVRLMKPDSPHLHLVRPVFFH